MNAPDLCSQLGRLARPAFHSRSAAHSALILGLVLCLGSCAKKGKQGGFTMPPMPVEVAEVHPHVVRDQFHALGSLEAQEIVKVVSELNATVRNIRFAEGQPVARGAVLVELDDREFRAEAQRAEAQHRQAMSNFERAQKLGDQQVLSTQELDNARTALKVAEANEAFARARFTKTRIRAPWAGLIGRRDVSPGAYLSPGDEIAELARVDLIKVAFAAPERYLGQLKRGIPVEVSTPAFPNETFRGEVTVVDPIIDPQTRTIQLVAQIPNSNRRLRPGMSANVTVTLAERALALVVPDEAVFAEGTQNFVYLVKPDGTVTRAAIELGTRDSADVEVLGGLQAGAVVVRTGHQKLFEGAKVMPVSNATSGTGASGGPPGSGAAPPRAAAKPSEKKGGQ